MQVNTAALERATGPGFEAFPLNDETIYNNEALLQEAGGETKLWLDEAYKDIDPVADDHEKLRLRTEAEDLATSTEKSPEVMLREIAGMTEVLVATRTRVTAGSLN